MRAKYYPVPDQPLLLSRVQKDLDEGFVEGDIDGFTPESFTQFVDHNTFLWNAVQSGRLQFSAIRDPAKRWPGGVVPYALSSRYTKDAKNKLAEVFSEYHRKTCIRFVPRKSQKDYLFIQPLGSYQCASSVGRKGGRQRLLLGAKCFQTGTMVHELMHALGFFHEQSRPDRDSFVTVQWGNIKPNQHHNFRKYPTSVINLMKTPYDYGSVMHYGKYYFSRNKQPTMVPKRKNVNIGQRRGFSAWDIRKINILYNCRK